MEVHSESLRELWPVRVSTGFHESDEEAKAMNEEEASGTSVKWSVDLRISLAILFANDDYLLR